MSDLAFVGRRRELARLQAHLDAVIRGGQGRFVSIRGRRQVGKSRLVTELVEHSGLPSLFFTAWRQPTVALDLQRFVADAARESTLPGAPTFEGVTVPDWESALRLVAAALPDGPAIIVFDELPWLIQADPGLEGTLQKIWDRVLERRPVLFLAIGSDVSMMESLARHGRPLFGRAKELVVEPFHPADTASMLDTRNAAAAIDAHLVTGGYPRLLLELRRSRSLSRFLREQLSDENSDLVVVGQRILDAEFPSEVQARRVLSAIGAGERAFQSIATRTGLSAAPLARSIKLLRDDKRVVATDHPLSTPAPDAPRHRIADPYLRFWLRFVEPAVADIARGRADLALARLEKEWTTWRGRAVEPVVREALERLAAEDERLGNARRVGGYWTRTNVPEVDLVGVDRFPGSGRVCFVGSIKWKERSPFSQKDLVRLFAHRAAVPGSGEAPTVVVSRSGVNAAGIDVTYDAGALLAAWRA